MCCEPGAKEKRDFLDAMKKRKRKTFTAWKLLVSDGQAALSSYWYHPGLNYALTAKGKRWRGNYNGWTPRGVHCLYTKAQAQIYAAPYLDHYVIPVQCHVDDLVVMGGGQYVLRKVTILKKDWPKKWKARK